MSMMGSSKYEFNPEQFGIDVKDKLKVAEQFKNDLRKVLYKEYKYLDGRMSHSFKRELLKEVHIEFIEGE